MRSWQLVDRATLKAILRRHAQASQRGDSASLPTAALAESKRHEIHRLVSNNAG